MKHKTKKLTTCAIFAAIICIVTTFIAIPAPAIGSINLGDIFILCAAWLLGPIYGGIAAGIGAALADLFSGFAIYAPATLIVKFLMAIVCCTVFSLLSKIIKHNFTVRILSALCAELVMVIGYFAYEAIVYGFFAALAAIPFNLIQGSVCLVIGSLVCHFMLKNSTIKGFCNEFSSL